MTTRKSPRKAYPTYEVMISKAISAIKHRGVPLASPSITGSLLLILYPIRISILTLVGL